MVYSAIGPEYLDCGDSSSLYVWSSAWPIIIPKETDDESSHSESQGSVGFRGAETNVDGRSGRAGRAGRMTSLCPYGLFLSCPRRRRQ